MPTPVACYLDCSLTEPPVNPPPPTSTLPPDLTSTARPAFRPPQVAETNARELYLRPVTPQQLLAHLPEDELAVKVSREDLEVGTAFSLCLMNSI